MADLLVHGVDDGIVQALKRRASAHCRSVEAEHRAILAGALMSPPRPEAVQQQYFRQTSGRARA
jgi:plasmid stability protein